MTTLEQLPDDVLLAVMQYLAVGELLTCRLVCKRLGALALHKDVWHHQRLTTDEDKRCVCAVLSLAPCLDSVVFCGGNVHLSAFATTTCAVRELNMRVTHYDKREQDVLLALSGLVLRNQIALGRLRRVSLKMCFGASETLLTPTETVFFDTLMKILLACSDLESLDIPSEIPCVPRAVLRGLFKSSLKYFRCPLGNKQSVTLVNYVLAGHANTLEDVDLTGKILMSTVEFYEMGTGGLQANLPKLRRLKCPVFLVLHAVGACKMLRDLYLWGDLFGVDPPTITTRNMIKEGAAVLLRQAHQLRTLSIAFDFNTDDARVLGVLLQALTFSGPHGLQRLELISIDEDAVEPLLRALPSLPALRELVIADFQVETKLVQKVNLKLLRGITPNTAPALRMLEFRLGYVMRCTHNWLHSCEYEVVRFFSVNPSVHIHLLEPYACSLKKCKGCKKDCHQQVPWSWEGHWLGLHAHGPDDCPSSEYHATGSTWAWLNVKSADFCTSLIL